VLFLKPSGPFANIPPCIEAQVEFIGQILGHAKGRTIEATPEAEKAWVEQCEQIAGFLLFSKYVSSTLALLSDAGAEWIPGFLATMQLAPRLAAVKM
jgi:hypothetical protein